MEMAQLVFAIAESPLEEGVIWAGTNDGFVHITRDGGGNWTNVTANIPDLPPWGTISNIDPSKHDAATAYMSVDFHQMNGRDPYVYKTTDYGQSWTSIGSDLPRSASSATCTGSTKTRCGRGCSTWAPRTPSTFRSTTAGTG